MYNCQEKRKYKRREKLYMAGVRVKQHEGRKRGSTGWDSVILHNLSAGGAFFTHRKDLGIDTLLDLRIDDTESILTINCVGKVTRIEQFKSTSTFCTTIKFIDIGKKEAAIINANVAEDLEQANKTSVA